MSEQNQDNNYQKVVGISGLKMDNSSITDTNISSTNAKGGNVGIFDTVMKDSNISKLNIIDNHQLSQIAKDKLKSYGVEDKDINELDEIVKQNSNDKQSFTSKAMKWLGGITTSIVSKGLSDNLPKIIAFISEAFQ